MAGVPHFYQLQSNQFKNASFCPCASNDKQSNNLLDTKSSTPIVTISNSYCNNWGTQGKPKAYLIIYFFAYAWQRLFKILFEKVVAKYLSNFMR